MRFSIPLISYLLLFFAGAVHADMNLHDIVPLTLGIPSDHVSFSEAAYNSKHNEFLIVYEYRNDFLAPKSQIHVTRRSATGADNGFFTIGNAAKYNDAPDVCYDPVNDQYLIVWRSYDSNNPNDIRIMMQRIPWDGPNSTSKAIELVSVPNSFKVDRGPVVEFDHNHNFFLVAFARYVPAASTVEMTGISINASTGQPRFPGTLDFSYSINGIEMMHDLDIASNTKNSDFFIVFSDGLDIRAMKLRGNSGPVSGSGATLPIATLFERDRFPSVAYLPSLDSYLVSWTGWTPAPGYDRVYARVFNKNGGASGNIVSISNDPSHTNYGPKTICSTINSKCAFFWFAIKGGITTYYLMGRSYDAGTSTLGRQELLQYLGAPSSLDTALGVQGAAGHNRFFITYRGMNSYNTEMLFGRGGQFSTTNPAVLLLLLGGD